MEGFNKHLRLFLITSALAVGGVAAALYYTLTRFNDIQLYTTKIMENNQNCAKNIEKCKKSSRNDKNSQQFTK